MEAFEHLSPAIAELAGRLWLLRDIFLHYLNTV